jgi:hypothetical protein
MYESCFNLASLPAPHNPDPAPLSPPHRPHTRPTPVPSHDIPRAFPAPPLFHSRFALTVAIGGEGRWRGRAGVCAGATTIIPQQLWRFLCRRGNFGWVARRRSGVCRRRGKKMEPTTGWTPILSPVMGFSRQSHGILITESTDFEWYILFSRTEHFGRIYAVSDMLKSRYTVFLALSVSAPSARQF